jgi:CBS domain-containing protein
MDLNKITAEDLMIKDLIIIEPDEKIALADLTMTRNNIGGLPVVDNGKLMGIITQRDVMFARNYEVGGLRVKELMSRDLVTVGPGVSLKEILNLMLDRKIERIPVVKDGVLLGLIVHDRILKAVRDTL